MKSRHEYKLLIRASGSDLSDDGWRERSAGHLETWQRAQELIATKSFLSQGAEVTIEINWSPVIASLRRYRRVMNQIDEHIVRHPRESWFDKFEFQRRPTAITCVVTIERKKRREREFPISYLESHLYNVFLLMNIADPGCAEFYRSTIKFVGKDASRWDRRPQNFSLSAAHFDVAGLRATEQRWPSPQRLPLDTVIRWFSSVRVGFGQIPRSRVEKVLFGLWHLCAEELNQTSVVWIFYCLETLLDTKPNENRRALFERLSLILQPDPKQAGYIKRSLDELYEYRSGLVHGGLEVYHPLQSDSLDHDVGQKYNHLMDVMDFGFAMLLVTLQIVIAKGWTAPKFTSSTVVGNDG